MSDDHSLELTGDDMYAALPAVRKLIGRTVTVAAGDCCMGAVIGGTLRLVRYNADDWPPVHLELDTGHLDVAAATIEPVEPPPGVAVADPGEQVDSQTSTERAMRAAGRHPQP